MKMKKTDRFIEAVFLIFVFVITAVLASREAFGMMPDEFSHFEVVYYIYKHGVIPTGYEPQIQVPYWGASYAFQPILTYIIQGFVMRFIDLFTDSVYAIMFSARLVNCAFGVIMAYFVRRISCLIWDDRSLQWLFTFLIVLLPENLYIHSYINTDSMAAMSVAIIIYALIKGEEDDFANKTIVTLAAGVSLCLLSYYNAYGAVLIAVIWFFAHFISGHRNADPANKGNNADPANKGNNADPANKSYRVMWKKFGLTTLLVCIMAGWWFVRSGILYHGDIFGLSARWELAVKEAEPQYSPLMKQTFMSQGSSLKDMLLSGDYLKTVYRSFICVMGNFDIQTADVVYHIDKIILAVGIIFAILPLRANARFIRSHGGASAGCPGNSDDSTCYVDDTVDKRHVRIYVELLLFADIVITVLLHMVYSYAYDWQPQGRYLLPMLVPLMYFLTLGFDKAGRLVTLAATKIGGIFGREDPASRSAADSAAKKINFIIRAAVMIYIAVVLIYTLKVKVLPLYFGNADFRSYTGLSWQQVITEFMQK